MGPADRSGAFKALLDVCKTGSTNAKKFAAEYVPEFMSKFPALFREALDAQMDLCEDDDENVRMQACRGLPKLCEHDAANAGSIADVLAQLMTIESPTELALARAGLLKVINANVASCVAALAKHCVGADAEEAPATRKKVIEFLVSNDVTKLISRLAAKDEATEVAVATALKSVISTPVTPEEFRLVFFIIRDMRTYKKAEKLNELVEIAATQAGVADGGASLDLTSAEVVGKIAACYKLVATAFYRGADASGLLRFVVERVLPVYDTVPADEGLGLLKLFAEVSKVATLETAVAALPAVYAQLSKQLGTVETAKAAAEAAEAAAEAAEAQAAAEEAARKAAEMKAKADAAAAAVAAAAAAGAGGADEPKEEGADASAAKTDEPATGKAVAPAGPAVKFTELECLLVAFHRLAAKVPRALPQLCGLVLKPKVFTGQPQDLMSASDLNTAEATRLKARLNELISVTKEFAARVRAGMKKLPAAPADATPEEKKAHFAANSKKRKLASQRVQTLESTARLAAALAGDDLRLLGGETYTPSWRPRRQQPVPGKGAKGKGAPAGKAKGGAGALTAGKKRKGDAAAGAGKKQKGAAPLAKQGKGKKGGGARPQSGGGRPASGGKSKPQKQQQQKQQQQQQGKKKKKAAGGAGGAGGQKSGGAGGQKAGGAKAQKRGRSRAGNGNGGGGRPTSQPAKKQGGGGGGGNAGGGRRKRGRARQ